MKYQEVAIDASFFRAYDIRGIINNDFSENAFYTIGRAVAVRLTELNKTTIVVARDGRLTSLVLVNALKQGLLDSGIDVTDIGLVSSPMMYFSTHECAIESGLMVTGSHNPGQYNGIKLVLCGKTLVQADITALYALTKKAQFINGCGLENSITIDNKYSDRIVSTITLDKPLKVVVDCGNGVAGPIVTQVIRALGCEVIPLFCTIDGRFPNHHPDPSDEKNLLDLKAEVVKQQADIGLAFDGDADRLGVVTNTATTIWPDRLMMYYARAILQKKPKSTIVYDVKCSAHLAQVIKENGGVAKMCATGHSIVKAVMKDTAAALAGEMSGHIFFKDRWYGFDDALYSAARLLELISQSDLSSEQQFLTIPNSINTPEIKIYCTDESKFLFMQRFSEESIFDNATIIRIDGLRVEYPYGWGIVRASNTTPCLVARFEAETKEHLERIQGVFKAKMLRIDKDLVIPF